MEKYVLTGGPGSGKSSIIISLEKKGEYVIREAAEDYIRLRQASGVKEPWTEPDFQRKHLKLQVQRESRVPREAKRIFIDRGLYDGLAYCEPESKDYLMIEKEASKAKYDAIFLIEPLGTVEKTVVRREGMEEALKIRHRLEQEYRKAGYDPISIKTVPLEERVAEVLQYARWKKIALGLQEFVRNKR